MRIYSTQVTVVVRGGAEPLPQLRVELFDRDRFSRDDCLGSDLTDGLGTASFRYTLAQVGDRGARGSSEYPELYAVVYDARGRAVHSTRDDAIRDAPRAHMMVEVPLRVVQAHHLRGIREIAPGE